MNTNYKQFFLLYVHVYVYISCNAIVVISMWCKGVGHEAVFFKGSKIITIKRFRKPNQKIQWLTETTKNSRELSFDFAICACKDHQRCDIYVKVSLPNEVKNLDVRTENNMTHMWHKYLLLKWKCSTRTQQFFSFE